MSAVAGLRHVDPFARRSRLYLAICRLSTTRVGMWLAANVSWKLDPILLKRTDGRFSSTGPVASALLETRGARTGQPRRTATLYFHDGNRVTIVASKQGRPEHPAWYHNILQNPEVVYGGIPFRAEVVEDEGERQRLWELADRVFPQYATYRTWAARSGRVIPIVQLVPREEPTAQAVPPPVPAPPPVEAPPIAVPAPPAPPEPPTPEPPPASSPPEALLPDYARQAEHYDETRAASPSVLKPLREALSGAPGRRLADIGGGTGNYALALKHEGWEPVVVDRSSGMLAHAKAKGLETVEADAQRLPFADGSFDAVMLISMLHHVEDRGRALSEAQRILRPGGRLVLMGFTREDAASLWIVDYFPSSRPWMEATHPPRATYLEALPGATMVEFQFEDMDDESLAALSADPQKVVAAGELGRTSFFERMARDHPDELARGLDFLREDIATSRAPSRAGTASVLAWTKS